MEFRLGVGTGSGEVSYSARFNPCSGGISSGGLRRSPCSMRPGRVSILVLVEFRLGVLFLLFCIGELGVSILVLVEFRLGAAMAFQGLEFSKRVSILVLVEFRLGEPKPCRKWCDVTGFNPCSGGISSGGRCDASGISGCLFVSILVLVEFRLGV